MKRDSPVDGFSDDSESTKRQRLPVVRHHRLKALQPGASLVHEHCQDRAIVEHLLRRAIGTALYSTGFDSVQEPAMESFLALAETYITHFTERTAQSMQLNRRTKVLPQDLIHVLSQYDLSASSLAPHLNLPFPSATTQPLISPSSPGTPLIDPAFAALLRDSNDTKTMKSYVPYHFPKFPSQHAYMNTPTYTKRETDAMRIREHATQEGILAEQALRKLMIAGKAGAQTLDHRKRVRLDPQQQRSEEVWQETLTALTQDDGNNASVLELGLDGLVEPALVPEDESGVTVNYERAYWRQCARDRTARAA